MIGSTHPLLDDFVSSLFIMPLVLWTVLVIYVFGDLFRDSEMNGAKKAWWAIAQFVLPLIGCLLYFLLNAESINRRQKRRNHPSDSHEDLPLILESMTELEIRTSEALELARATFAAQSEHSEFIAQTTRNVEAANAALKLDGEKVVRLSEAFQEVNFAMNEQSSRLSTLAQELRSNQSGLTNTTERLQQLWAASESAKDVALIQIQQSEQLKELDDTIQYLHRAFAGQSEQLDQMSQDDTHDRVIELSEQVAQLEGLLNGAASTQSNHSDALNKLNLAQQELRDMLTMKSQELAHLSGATQTLRVEQKNLLQELSELSKGISLLQELSQAPRDETGMAKELSRAADDAQELREILGAQSELLNQLSNTYQAAVGVQEEHSQQLERLAQRMQSHPLTLDVEDVEEYIRQIARSKE